MERQWWTGWTAPTALTRSAKPTTFTWSTWPPTPTPFISTWSTAKKSSNSPLTSTHTPKRTSLSTAASPAATDSPRRQSNWTRKNSGQVTTNYPKPTKRFSGTLLTPIPSMWQSSGSGLPRMMGPCLSRLIWKGRGMCGIAICSNMRIMKWWSIFVSSDGFYKV